VVTVVGNVDFADWVAESAVILFTWHTCYYSYVSVCVVSSVLALMPSIVMNQVTPRCNMRQVTLSLFPALFDCEGDCIASSWWPTQWVSLIFPEAVITLIHRSEARQLRHLLCICREPYLKGTLTLGVQPPTLQSLLRFTLSKCTLGNICMIHLLSSILNR
jgi:hypothetical protein